MEKPMIEKERTENKSLYCLKVIACFSVVSLHFELPTHIGDIFFVFARFAVPFFFMIAGYFSCFSKEEEAEQTIARRLRKLFVLVMGSFLFYFLLNLLLAVKDGHMQEWLVTVFNLKNLLLLLICNWTTPLAGVGHLWYMLALIYVYVIYRYINRLHLHNIIYILSPIVLLGVVLIEILDFYSVVSVQEIYYRNFLFVGFPFFMIGNFLNRYQEKFIIRKKKKCKFLLAGLMIGILLLAEYYVFEKSFNIYLSSILFALFGFLFVLNFPEGLQSRPFVYIGKYCSSDIYLWHYVFIIIFVRYLSKFRLLYKTGTIWIFGLALLTSIGLQLCRKRYRIVRKGKKVI